MSLCHLLVFLWLTFYILNIADVQAALGSFKSKQIIKISDHLNGSNTIVKFADDTVVLGLISNNDEIAYIEAVKLGIVVLHQHVAKLTITTLALWC